MSVPPLALFGGPPVRPAGPPGWPRRTAATDAVLSQLRDSGDWGRYHGPHADALCQIIAQSTGCEHVHLCSSGTVAVELALRAAQIGADDEVIMSAYDFKANFTNIALLGATPVLVDCRECDAQLDVSQVETAITGKTKAIIASHLQGGLVDMPAIREIAEHRKVTLIEDVCQSPGAMIAGRPAGDWGDIATFSFGGSKLLTAGRGGAVVTNRPEVTQRIRLYTQRGNDAYPLSEMQAAILLPQWRQLTEDNVMRQKTLESLGELRGMTRFGVGDKWQEAGARDSDSHSSPLTSHLPAFYKVGFWYDPATFDGLPRDRFCQALRAEGIAFDPGFPGLHQIHARRRFRASGELPHATRACAQVVMLHHPILLEGESAVDEIRLALDKVARHATMLRESPMTCDPQRD